MFGYVLEEIVKDTTMQELGMENETHLCDSCHEEMPECDPKYIIFGTGKGKDNIAACNIHNPVHTRNYEEERYNILSKR